MAGEATQKISGLIRPVRASDKTSWEIMWLGYQDYYEVDLSATTQNTWQRLLAPPPEGPYCLVREDEDGELIGFVTYLFHGHTWQPEPRCYLVDLYTAPQQRGKRVGRSLIEAVYEKSDEFGSTQVYWMTQDFNEAGRRLYDKIAKLTPFIKYQR